MSSNSRQSCSPGGGPVNPPATPFLEGPLGPSGRRWVRVFALAVVVDFALVLLFLGHRIGASDLDQFLVFHELQYWNACLSQGPKQWCPLLCSGISLASEPQVPVFSLSMLLGYVTDPFWGIRLATLIYLAAGWLGAYLYARLLFPQRLQRALAASLFIGNGFFICRIAVGHVDFIPFLLFPAALDLLHRSAEWARQPKSARSRIRFVLALLLLAAGIAVSVDGSPVTVLHALFWVFLYGAVLAAWARSAAPLLMLVLAATLAAFLDAGYLWPMLDGQWDAPRLRPDAFTHPLALPWYLLVPTWGRFFLPANGKGHELSVFIGPVLGVLIWRYRRPLWQALPKAQKLPLVVVALASFWLGMGSLGTLHVPRWLSPFDLLRPLPGFRSIGVTGRYWGFLALPLSLFSAGSLWAFLREHPGTWKAALGVGFALLMQLGAQTTALLSPAVRGRSYHPVAWRDGSEVDRTPRFVLRADRLQGELVAPDQAVIDCYDEDDIPHADVAPGTGLVRSLALPEGSDRGGRTVRARFQTWNRIRIEAEPLGRDYTIDRPPGVVEVALNQAYHRHWTAPGCDVLRGSGNLLVLRCPESRLSSGPVELSFLDRASDLGWDVSTVTWRVWLGVLTALLLVHRDSRRSSAEGRRTSTHALEQAGIGTRVGA